MSPIWARKACAHVGHMWVGTDVAEEAALALHTARLVCASLMRLVDGWPLAVGPEVAGESNPGSEGPPVLMWQ